MPCYQQVENRWFRQRRFTRADTREVSAGVFHHPFRVFRPEPQWPGKWLQRGFHPVVRRLQGGDDRTL